MSGGIQIFKIELPLGALACWRDFAGEYRLECSSASLGCGPLTIGEGWRLGYAGELISSRLSFAHRSHRAVNSKPAVARREGTGELIAEIAAVDLDTIEFRLFGSSKMLLQDQEAEGLLIALRRLYADACGIPGRSSGGIASKLAR